MVSIKLNALLNALVVVMHAFSVTQLSKQYGARRALDGVNLALEPGKALALLGPNGAGKTTLVHCLLGLIRPDGGEVRLFGADPSIAQTRAQVGAVLQLSALPAKLTPLELLGLHASYFDAAIAPHAALALCNASELAHRRCGELSGGERRRVEIAIALIGRPKLLILDEPTVGLDPMMRRTLINAIQALKDSGVAILLTTHLLDEAQAIADRVAVLHQGRLVLDLPTAELAAQQGVRLRARSQLADTTLQSLPGVRSVRRELEQVELISSESDHCLRAWLSLDPTLSAIRISDSGLEQGLFAITSSQLEHSA